MTQARVLTHWRGKGRIAAFKNAGDRPAPWRMVPLVPLLIFLGMLTAASMVLAVGLGPVRVPAETVYRLVLERFAPWLGVASDAPSSERLIVLSIRVPRVLLGAMVGGGLSVSGAVLQALLRNPLADPYLIGVSSGATLGAVMVLMLPALPLLGLSLPLAAFAGALAAFCLVLVVAKRRGRITPSRLVLSGVAVAALLTALTQWLIISSQNDAMRAAMSWTLGNLAGIRMERLGVPAAISIPLVAVLWVAAGRVNALMIGEAGAASLGVNVERMRAILVVLCALLVGTLVAISGSIGFVALIVPHTVRLLFGADLRRAVPICAIGGAAFLVWADVAARLVIQPSEIPIGVITALLGAPFFLVVLRRVS